MNVPFKVIFSRDNFGADTMESHFNSSGNMNPCGLNFPHFVSKGLFTQESELWQRLKTYVKRCLTIVVWPESFSIKKVVNLLGK